MKEKQFHIGKDNFKIFRLNNRSLHIQHLQSGYIFQISLSWYNATFKQLGVGYAK
jgi:hypothetical protein